MEDDDAMMSGDEGCMDEDYEYEYEYDEDGNYDGADCVKEGGGTESEQICSNTFEILLSDLPTSVPHYTELLKIYTCLKELVLLCPYAVFYDWDYLDKLKYRTALLTVYGKTKPCKVYRFRVSFPSSGKIFPEGPPALSPLTVMPAMVYIASANHPLLAAKNWNPCQHLPVLFQGMLAYMDSAADYCKTEACLGGVLEGGEEQAIEVLVSELCSAYVYQVKEICPDLKDSLEAMSQPVGGILRPCDPEKDLTPKKALSGIGYSRGREGGAGTRTPGRVRVLVGKIHRRLSAITSMSSNELSNLQWVLASPLAEMLIVLLNECSREEIDRSEDYTEQIFTIALRLDQLYSTCPLSVVEQYTERRRTALREIISEIYSRLAGFETDGLLDGSMPWLTSLKASSPAYQQIMDEQLTQRAMGTAPIIEERVHHIANLESGHYFYKAPIEKASSRWLRELAYIADNLPEEVHLFVAEEHPNYLTASMTIANPDCPYYGGLFLFHIQVPGDYPNRNPSVHFMTTGEGSVRFNPNLYNCGKVCLSLLGTWQGEPWNPKSSNMTQVLKSILYLIFTEQPYYNEPGYDSDRGSADSEARSNAYDAEVIRNTVHWAVEYHFDRMAQYPEALQEVIKAYYARHWETIKPVLQGKFTSLKLGGKMDQRLERITQHVRALEPQAAAGSESKKRKK